MREREREREREGERQHTCGCVCARMRVCVCVRAPAVCLRPCVRCGCIPSGIFRVQCLDACTYRFVCTYVACMRACMHDCKHPCMYVCLFVCMCCVHGCLIMCIIYTYIWTDPLTGFALHAFGSAERRFARQGTFAGHLIASSSCSSIGFCGRSHF